MLFFGKINTDTQLTRKYTSFEDFFFVVLPNSFIKKKLSQSDFKQKILDSSIQPSSCEKRRWNYDTWQENVWW
jgi:hypothetical protein